MTRRILNRWTGAVIWEGEAATIKDAVHAALTGANLTGADLRDADLRDADLTGADLTGADLTGAALTGANLTGANLRGADLTPIRDDFYAVLSAAPVEVPALIAALRAGQVDGSTYDGPCACLVGTIANARHCDVEDIPELRPNSARPIERFFLAIRPGDTPETSQPAMLAVEWAEGWLGRMRVAFAPAEGGVR